MGSGDLRRPPALGAGPAFHDARDLTPFRDVRVHVSVKGVLDRFGRRSEPPRLRRLASRVEREVYRVVFTGSGEDLLLLARAHPGWAGLCQLLAGLRAYRAHRHARAAELLARGVEGRNDPEAAAFVASYLAVDTVWVEVAEGIFVETVFGEEAVRLALAHSLREIGHPEEALCALEPLPASLPRALAAARIAETLGRGRDVVAWTDGLTNRDDLAAVLLVIRARALRRLGRRGEARETLREVLRRRRTAFTVRNAAMTEWALVTLGVGRRSGGAGPPSPGELRRRRNAEASEQWLRDFERLSGRDPGR